MGAHNSKMLFPQEELRALKFSSEEIEMLYAEKGKGQYREGQGATEKRIPVSPKANPVRSAEITAKSQQSRNPLLLSELQSKLDTRNNTSKSVEPAKETRPSVSQPAMDLGQHSMPPRDSGNQKQQPVSKVTQDNNKGSQSKATTASLKPLQNQSGATGAQNGTEVKKTELRSSPRPNRQESGPIAKKETSSNLERQKPSDRSKDNLNSRQAVLPKPPAEISNNQSLDIPILKPRNVAAFLNKINQNNQK